MRQLEKGDIVETIHGEEIEILDIQEVPAKTKKGEVVEAGKTMVLAVSGDNKCWFSTGALKLDDEGAE